MNKLYEILVPTRWGDKPDKPIRTAHHKQWDIQVQKITGGLTVLSPSKGKWIFEGKEYHEKVIPVRIMCEEKDIDKIVQFTIRHYRQIAVMYYCISQEVYIVYAK